MANLLPPDDAVFETSLGRWWAEAGGALPGITPAERITSNPDPPFPAWVMTSGVMKLSGRGSWISGGSEPWVEGTQGYAYLLDSPGVFSSFPVTPGELIRLSFYTRQSASNEAIDRTFIHCQLFNYDNGGANYNRLFCRTSGDPGAGAGAFGVFPTTQWTQVTMYLRAAYPNCNFFFQWGGNRLAAGGFFTVPVSTSVVVYVANIMLESVPFTVPPPINPTALVELPQNRTKISWTKPVGLPTIIGASGGYAYGSHNSSTGGTGVDQSNLIDIQFPGGGGVGINADLTTYYRNGHVDPSSVYQLRTQVSGGWTGVSYSEWVSTDAAPTAGIAIIVSDLDNPGSGTPPLNGDWDTWKNWYPAEAEPFLSGFTGEGPHARASLHIRDYSGRLVAVYPIVEATDDRGNDGTEYPQSLTRSADGSFYFTGWSSGAIFRLSPTGEIIWRREGWNYETVASATTGPGISPDGQYLFVQNDNYPSNTSYIDNLAVLRVSDGSLAFHRNLTFTPAFNTLQHYGGGAFFPYGMVNMPDGRLLAVDGNDYHLFAINMSTGAAEHWLDLNTLDLPRRFNRGFDMDLKPDGTGFVIATMTPASSSDPSISHSALIEIDWDGNVLNYYTKDTEDVDDHEWMNNVTYSGDGKYLFASSEGGTYLWRFEVGPGNKGGGEPFMNMDYASYRTWQLDGGYGNEAYDRNLWLGTYFGVAAWGSSDTAGGSGWGLGVVFPSG